MQDDFNKDSFNNDQNEDNSNQDYFGNGDSFRYQHQEDDRNEIPRWTPYEEPNGQPPKKNKPGKSNKTWIIPLVIILAVMVIAIGIGIFFGSRQLSRIVNEAKTEISQDVGTGDGSTQPSAEQSNKVKTSSPGGLILTDVSDVVDEVMPAVVSITSRQLVDSGIYGSYWDFFFGGGYGGNSEGSTQEVDAGYGSGTIIGQTDSELLILTSYHVVEGSSSLYVTFTDGSDADGYIKSQSEEKDIAIVAVPLSNVSDETISAIRVASLSDQPAEVGEGVIVIGNALGYGMSVTSGIVSAIDRELPTSSGGTVTVLQTDAAINAGNSGGCVVNQNGEIVGISEAKIVIQHVEGMCYAIQISSNYDVIQSLLNENSDIGADVSTNNPSAKGTGQGAYLGIRGRDVDSALANSYGMPQGVYVATTVSGGGAEAAGLQEGDIIVGMDNVSFSTMEELQQQLANHNPGDKVTLIVMRKSNDKYSQMKVDVTLTDAIS